jgi:hypothetical protein
MKKKHLHPEDFELLPEGKGCKLDCPMNVDMATYKAEFLSHYYAGKVRPAAIVIAMGSGRTPPQ